MKNKYTHRKKKRKVRCSNVDKDKIKKHVVPWTSSSSDSDSEPVRPGLPWHLMNIADNIQENGSDTESIGSSASLTSSLIEELSDFEAADQSFPELIQNLAAELPDLPDSESSSLEKSLAAWQSNLW